MKQVYESSEPLRIGYYENDGFQQPSPSMARAFRETKALLERAGHTVHNYTTLIVLILAIGSLLANKGYALFKPLTYK